jgi:phenylacetate-coenzyme A ligase PaaK-like adenylate-forming protein
MHSPPPRDDASIELSVIVPCLNEEGNIPELSSRVLRMFDVGELSGELVLVDDGSTDGTRAAIERLEAAHPGRVRGVIHSHNQGIAAGWRGGCEASRGDLCAIIDADLQYQPEDLLRMRRALYERSVDIVQGWRSAVGRDKGPRWYYSRGFNWLLNRTFSMDLSDNKSGFLVCAREVLADLLSFEGEYRYWQSFIMVAAKAKGYSYHEVETLFMSRLAGTSFLEQQAIRVSILCFVDLGKAAWEYRLARRPPDVAQRFLDGEDDPDGGTRWETFLSGLGPAPAVGSHRRDTARYLAAMERTGSIDVGTLGELQDEKLRRLVRHAYRDVPFYRHAMRGRGLRPEDVKTRADLPRLPTLDRSTMREHLYFDILSEHHDKRHVFERRACGWQGEPLGVFVDRVQLERRLAAGMRGRGWAGYTFGATWVRLWDEPTTPLRSKTDRLLGNLHHHPIEVIDEEVVTDLVRNLSRLRPAVVEGSTEVLLALSRFMLRHGPCLTGCVSAVLVTGHTLTAEGRQSIGRAFGGEVFEAYGTAEIGEVAHECKHHGGLHVAEERVIVELLDPSGDPVAPGERGEIVVTDLDNSCLPMIRFRTGDHARAVTTPCECGVTLSRITDVEGRHATAIGHAGRWLVGGFMAHWFAERGHAVKRYRVSHRPVGKSEPAALTVDIVKAGRFNDELVHVLSDAIRERLGDDLTVEVRLFQDDACWDEAPSIRPSA